MSKRPHPVLMALNTSESAWLGDSSISLINQSLRWLSISGITGTGIAKFHSPFVKIVACYAHNHPQSPTRVYFNISGELASIAAIINIHSIVVAFSRGGMSNSSKNIIIVATNNCSSRLGFEFEF